MLNASKINFIYIIYSRKIVENRLKGQCTGLQHLIFILNYSRVSHFFISRWTMFHIIGSGYLTALKPQLTVFTDSNWNSVCWRRLYWILSSVEKFHALSEQANFLLFHTALLLIFLDFLNELFHNYLSLEVFQMQINCHSKSS